MCHSSLELIKITIYCLCSGFCISNGWWWWWLILPSSFSFWYGKKCIQYVQSLLQLLLKLIFLFHMFQFLLWIDFHESLFVPCSYGWKVKFLCFTCKSSNRCHNSFTYKAFLWALCCTSSGALDFHLWRTFCWKLCFLLVLDNNEYCLIRYNFMLAIT